VCVSVCYLSIIFYPLKCTSGPHPLHLHILTPAFFLTRCTLFVCVWAFVHVCVYVCGSVAVAAGQDRLPMIKIGQYLVFGIWYASCAFAMVSIATFLPCGSLVDVVASASFSRHPGCRPLNEIFYAMIDEALPQCPPPPPSPPKPRCSEPWEGAPPLDDDASCPPCGLHRLTHDWHLPQIVDC